jgi:hypothetical protein
MKGEMKSEPSGTTSTMTTEKTAPSK